MAVEQEVGAVAELAAMLDAATKEEGCVVFDHTPEEIGLHVMENHATIRAALATPTPVEEPAKGAVDSSRVDRTDWFKGHVDCEGHTMPDNPLFLRACEVVRHRHGCAGISKGDEHCTCDAVKFLDDLAAALASPANPVASVSDEQPWVEIVSSWQERALKAEEALAALQAQPNGTKP